MTDRTQVWKRLATIILGYFAAAAVGLIVPAGFLFIGFPDKPVLSHIVLAVGGIVSLMVVVSGMMLVPALVVIAILEVLRVRKLFAYLMLGIIVSFSLSIYAVGFRNTGDQSIAAITLVIGAAAGFAYWRIAGRDAGRWREAKADSESRLHSGNWISGI